MRGGAASRVAGDHGDAVQQHSSYGQSPEPCEGAGVAAAFSQQLRDSSNCGAQAQGVACVATGASRMAARAASELREECFMRKNNTRGDRRRQDADLQASAPIPQDFAASPLSATSIATDPPGRVRRSGNRGSSSSHSARSGSVAPWRRTADTVRQTCHERPFRAGTL